MQQRTEKQNKNSSNKQNRSEGKTTKNGSELIKISKRTQQTRRRARAVNRTSMHETVLERGGRRKRARRI
jgi:hypothetical protein